MRGAAITLEDGVWGPSNYGDSVVPRITDMPRIAVHMVSEHRTANRHGRARFASSAPAFAIAIALLTGKPPRERPFKLG